MRRILSLNDRDKWKYEMTEETPDADADSASLYSQYLMEDPP